MNRAAGWLDNQRSYAMLIGLNPLCCDTFVAATRPHPAGNAAVVSSQTGGTEYEGQQFHVNITWMSSQRNPPCRRVKSPVTNILHIYLETLRKKGGKHVSTSFGTRRCTRTEGLYCT